MTKTYHPHGLLDTSFSELNNFVIPVAYNYYTYLQTCLLYISLLGMCLALLQENLNYVKMGIAAVRAVAEFCGITFYLHTYTYFLVNRYIGTHL